MNACVGFAIIFESVRFIPMLCLSFLCASLWVRRYGQGPLDQRFFTWLGLFTALLIFSLFLWSLGDRPPLRELLLFDYQCVPRR